MEVRFIRFNIRDFLEGLYICETGLDRDVLMNNFMDFYNKSTDSIKEQTVLYIESSLIYTENPELAEYIKRSFKK